MLNRYFWVTLFSTITAGSALADSPQMPTPPKAPPPIRLQVLRPVDKHFPPRLILSHDPNATSAQLILPEKLAAALKPTDAPRVAAGLPGAVVGLTLTGSLIAGGLWLVRRPRWKFAMGLLLPLGFAFIGLAVHAQPTRLDSPRTTIETSKIRISRSATADVQLILPKREKAAPAKPLP